MKNCVIEMFPALHGDCFLVRCAGKPNTNILIDTGLSSTYKNFLRDRLIQLRNEGEKLALMVITHIDADHIWGGLNLLEENGHNQAPKIIEIERIWHNSYRHLQFEVNQQVGPTPKQQAILDSIVVKGFPIESESMLDNENQISAWQGSSLGALILKGGYSWNKEFDGQAVVSDTSKRIQLSENVTLTLLSPSRKKLDALKTIWKQMLRREGFGDALTTNAFFDDAFEFLVSQEQPEIPLDIERPASYSIPSIETLLKRTFTEDTRATNGSSIAFILEYYDKKFLFLGDSHPSMVEKSLCKLYQGKTPIYFDAIKVSHHGSSGNTSPRLLELVDSVNYLISTNGERFEHPDLETLFRIVRRQTERKRRIQFNYPFQSPLFLNSDIMEKYKYSVFHPAENEIGITSVHF